jgi:DNA-binding PadR family transcriptional regulator
MTNKEKIMFGMRGYEDGGRGHWAGGRHGHRGHGHGFGWGRGRHGGHGGPGGGDMFRIGRMFAQGDLKLVVLALVAEQPRHGYEIIKVIEEKTSGIYSPSPGIVYPTLTFLEESGYLVSESEGSKKLYKITPEGETYLKPNRDIVETIMDRLSAFGRRAAKMRRAFGGDADNNRLPQVVDAAVSNLREAASKRLEADEEAETKIVEILMKAASEIKNG